MDQPSPLARQLAHWQHVLDGARAALRAADRRTLDERERDVLRAQRQVEKLTRAALQVDRRP